MAYPEVQATNVKAQLGTTPNEALPSPKIWDQVSNNHKEPTDECRRRVGCDIREAKYNGILGDLVYAQQNTTAKIHTLILGPPGTPYDGSDSTRGTVPNQQLSPLSFWFLVSSEHEGPTHECRLRVECGVDKVKFYRVDQVFISTEHNSTAKIHALILGPPGTPYQGNASAPRTAPNHRLPPPRFWCPVSSEHEEPTDECWRRVGCFNRKAQFWRVPRMSISSEENNTAEVNGLILRTGDMPYEASDSAGDKTPKKQLGSAYSWDLVSYERKKTTNQYRHQVGCGIRKAELCRLARVFVPVRDGSGVPRSPRKK